MTRFDKDGFSGELRPSFELLVEKVLAAPGRVIKESTVKLVTTHDVSGVTYFVKRYRPSAMPLRSFKYFLKRSPAADEWDLSQKLDRLNIPIVRHLAWLEKWTRSGLQEAVVVTEGFAGVSLNEFALSDFKPLLEFLEQLCNAGVFHHDLHPANILVRAVPFEIRLVDLHGIKIKKRITPAEREKMLAFLRIFVPIPVPEQVQQLSHALRKEAFARRSKRCLKHNRDFGPRNITGRKWQVRLACFNPVLESILENPDRLGAAGASVLKSGQSSTVTLTDRYVVKRFNFRKLANLIKDRLRPSRARRAFRKAYHLELTNIPTAQSIACAEDRKFGIATGSYFVMEAIAGARDPRQWIGDRRQLIDRIAKLIAHLHHEGFAHRDLKLTNIVIDGKDQPRLIDLEGLRFIRNVSRRRVLADLARLAENAIKLTAITPGQQLAFLRVYWRARRLGFQPSHSAQAKGQ